MNKKIRIIPLLLLVIYILTIGRSDKVSFEIKLFIIVFITLISLFVVHKMSRNGDLSNKRIYIFLAFLVITLGLFFTHLFKVL